MIDFQKYHLDNGLTVILHHEPACPSVTVNVLYGVGSRNEDESHTGFAHLFEHLMFGGSVNIPVFDEPVQRVGGQNNAFTSQDITNYYTTVPYTNIETALWVEADRLRLLDFSETSLEVQKKVVIEEFKQRYLNQPFGKQWLNIWPLAYKKHSYRWAVIGKELSHIENSHLDSVKAFFFKYYSPKNAILSVAGNINESEVKALIEKHFGTIDSRDTGKYVSTSEEPQTAERTEVIAEDVPVEAVFSALHMGPRMGKDFYAEDLLSDILGRGKSGYLFKKLVKEQRLFSDAAAYTIGSADPGLFFLDGKLSPGVTAEEGKQALFSVLEDFKNGGLTEAHFQQSKNQSVSSTTFSRVDVSSRALNLAYYEWLKDASEYNLEVENLEAVTFDQVVVAAKRILRIENSSTLLYKKG